MRRIRRKFAQESIVETQFLHGGTATGEIDPISRRCSENARLFPRHRYGLCKTQIGQAHDLRPNRFHSSHTYPIFCLLCIHGCTGAALGGISDYADANDEFRTRTRDSADRRDDCRESGPGRQKQAQGRFGVPSGLVAAGRAFAPRGRNGAGTPANSYDDRGVLSRRDVLRLRRRSHRPRPAPACATRRAPVAHPAPVRRSRRDAASARDCPPRRTCAAPGGSALQ